MIHDLLLIIFFACLSSGISYMLDYGLGKPGSDEISVNELFTGWTFMLARGRLIDNYMFDEIEDAFIIPKDASAYTKVIMQREFKKTVIEKGKEFFTYEKIFGMCIICTGFYIALITATLAYFTIQLQQIPNYFYFISTPVFSHFILRKL